MFNSPTKTLCATGEMDPDNKETSRFTFWDLTDNKELDQAGFYVNGLRNSSWTYIVNGAPVQIDWGAYEDKNLHFKTNLFANADSTKYGDFYTTLQYKTDKGKVNITITINSPLKDSFPEKNYRLLAERQFASINCDILEMNQKRFGNKDLHIYAFDIALRKKNLPDTGVYYLKTAFGRIGNDYIEFAVSYHNRDNYYAAILFEGVLTNFYLSGRRLFNPFTSFR